MNKKIIIALLVLIFLLFGLVFFVYKQNNNFAVVNPAPLEGTTTTLMTEREKSDLGLYHLGVYEVLARDESGLITEYQLVGMEEPMEVTPEIITDAKTEGLIIQPEVKIQVLERDPSGNISAYRVIKDEEELIKEY